MNVALIVLAAITILYVSHEIEKRKREERFTDFDLATMNEKFMRAEQTRINLNAMENLATDLAASSPEMQIVLQIQWLGFDGEKYTYDLFCDGINTASDNLKEITEREIHELREELAYECAELNYETMHRRDSRQFVPNIKKIGEWLNAGKDVREMWNDDEYS